MGINNAHKVTHQITGVKWEELIKIINNRCTRRVVDTGTDKPTIDIDVSYVYRKMQHLADMKRRVSTLIRMCDMFCQHGIRVVLVCDADKRHHSKRATIERQSNMYQKKIDLYNTRCQLMSITNEINSTDSVCQKQKFQKELKEISNKCVKLENYVNSSCYDVGNSLFEMLIEQAADLKKKEPSTDITVLQSEFQADYTIAYRTMQQLNDIVIMSDTDLAALCGSECVAINKFKFKEEKGRNSTLTGIEIFVADIEKLTEVGNIIDISIDNNKRMKISQTPLFEGFKDPEVRALIAVGIGCDVYVGGVSGISLVNFHTFLQKIKQQHKNQPEHFHSLILHHYYHTVNNNTLDEVNFKNMITIFADAFLYEPGNFRMGPEDSKQEVTYYVHGKEPSSLHKYIQEFTRNNTDIPIKDVGCEECISVCTGGGKGEHVFLSLEGYTECAACNTKCCRHCVFDHMIHRDMNDVGEDVDEEIKVSFCVNCYVSELAVDRKRMENSLSKQEMIQQLSSIASFEVQQTDPLSDIIDLYDCLVNNPHNQIFNNNVMDSIIFPKECANYLKEQVVLLPFDLKDGAQFITDERLSTQQRINLLDLMSTLINFDNEDVGDPTNYRRLRKEYKVIPAVLIKFAEGSRLHSGFRLLKRTIRHTMDPASPSIINATGYVSTYDNEICITLSHTVKASMKSDCYAVQVCFTKSSLVSCACSCKAGAFGRGRVVCVHILPVIYSMTQLMFDGLSTHILGQFTSVFNETEEAQLDQSEKSKLKLILCRINTATGKYKRNNKFSLDSSVTEILQSYIVGTERAKFGPGPPRSIAALGPLRYVNSESGTFKASKVLHFKPDKVPTNVQETNDVDEWNRNNYVKTRCLIKAFSNFFHGADLDFLDCCVGFQLLNLRRRDNNSSEISTIPDLDEYENHIMNLAILSASNTCRITKERRELENLISNPDLYKKKQKRNSPIPPKNTPQRKKKTKKQTARKKIPRKVNTNKSKLSPKVACIDIGTDSTNTATPKTSLKNDYITYKFSTEKKLDPKVRRRINALIKVKHKGCCACDNTNVKKPDAIFTKIPKGPTTKVPDSLPNNYLRRQYYISKFKRNLFLTKLNLLGKRATTGLLLCNRHRLIQYDCSIDWFDVDGNKQTVNEKIIAPVNSYASDFNSMRKRSALLSPRSSTKKKKIVHIIEKTNAMHGLNATNIIDTPPKAKTRNQIRKAQENTNLPAEQHIVITKDLQEDFKNSSKTNPRRCAFPSCRRQHCPDQGIFLRKIPIKHPPFTWIEHRFNKFRRQYACRQAHRNKLLNRIGSNSFEARNDLRICNLHAIEKFEATIHWIGTDKEKHKSNVVMDIPLAIGEKSSTNMEVINKHSGGVGNQRALFRNKKGAEELGNSGDDVYHFKLLYGEAMDKYENEKYLREQNIPVEKPLPKYVNKFVLEYDKKENVDFEPEMVDQRFDKVTNRYIKDTTGFSSMLHMLSFACVICKGDVRLIFATNSKLTWFEEWLMYFQFIWGKPVVRWADATDKYNKSDRRLRYIFDRKLSELHLRTRAEWPIYASLGEDCKLRDEKWNVTYGNKRVVMWDNTAITMKGKPSDPELQRNTYSSYYAANVAKGAVFLQLCGWLGTCDLWVGAVSDTEYMKRSGILSQQKEFLEKEKDNKDINWINILDKGYRVGAAAWQAGGQLVLQPTFAKAEQKFSSHETIRSAGIAADRSANERAVNRCKGCGYLQQGLKTSMDYTRISDVWLAWSFQANFMYKPVL